MWLVLNNSGMRKEEQGLERAEKRNEIGNQREIGRGRDQQQDLLKEEGIFDEEFWIKVSKMNIGMLVTR